MRVSFACCAAGRLSMIFFSSMPASLLKDQPSAFLPRLRLLVGASAIAERDGTPRNVACQDLPFPKKRRTFFAVERLLSARYDAGRDAAIGRLQDHVFGCAKCVRNAE